jgi:SAM-dependent methyltransferase
MSAPVQVARAAARKLLPRPLRIRIINRMSSMPRLRKTLPYGREFDLIDRELTALDGKPWDGFRTNGSTVDTSERVVEIPWILSRYQSEGRVLDIGSAFALALYIRYLRQLHIPELHGVDLGAARVGGMTMARADVRHMPYEDAYFDLILCVSTLEHIGRDNVNYGVGVSDDARGDYVALAEMRRVLSPTGRILITVPFGRPGDYGWFKQFDLASFDDLLNETRLTAEELSVYGYSASGWAKVRDPSTQRGGYREDGAPAATAVLCAALRR